MNPQQELELLEGMAQLRRENRRLRGWVIFTGMGVGILLFAPGLAALIASWSAQLLESAFSSAGGFISAILAIAFVVLVAAVIVSNLYGSGPKPGEQPSGDA